MHKKLQSRNIIVENFKRKKRGKKACRRPGIHRNQALAAGVTAPARALLARLRLAPAAATLLGPHGERKCKASHMLRASRVWSEVNRAPGRLLTIARRIGFAATQLSSFRHGCLLMNEIGYLSFM